MFEEIERLTRALCAEHGTSGCEGDVFKVAKKELGFCKEVCENELGGVVGIFGDLSSKRRILLDAHIDQIGMIVTDIDENGFLHVTNVGGVDRRTLPGSPVTVFGTETVTGIGCTLPPHLAKGDDKIKPVAEQCVDLGLPKEEVEKLVAVGDRAALTRPLKKLMGNRITGTALDDRAGCACVIRAAQLNRTPIAALWCCAPQRRRSAGRARRSLRMHLSPPRPLPWTFRSQSSRTRRACLPRSSAKGR